MWPKQDRDHVDDWPEQWHGITDQTIDDRDEVSRRSVLKTGGAAAGVALGGSLFGTSVAAANSGSGSKQDLVGTWAAGMHKPSSLAERSLTGFANETLRMMPRASIGGSGVRIRLANTYGDKPVTFGHVEVGIRDGGATVVPSSNQTVTFGGSQSVTVRDGGRAYSDPVDLDVAPEQDLAVSLYMPNVTGPATAHQTARKTSYIGSGDQASDTQGGGYSERTPRWFFLDGIDVIRSKPSSAVVCLGDSITDGTASSLNTNNTYPDYLAERLNDSTLDKSALNAGIAGNRVLRDSYPGAGFGESTLDRLDRDVLAQTDVTDVVFLEGINDIGQEPSASAEAIIQGQKQIVARVHARELNILGATLTPFEGALAETPEFLSAEYYGPSGYYTEEKENKRQQVNEFIRTSGAYDGVVDFDEAIRDPEQPKRIQPKYDSGDHLHPNDAGYRKMAEAVDLSLLRSSR